MGIKMIWYIMKSLKELASNKKVWLVIVFIFAFSCWGANQMAKESTDSIENLEITIGIVDKDQSTYSKMLLKYFESSKELQQFAEVKVGTEENMKQYFKNGEVVAYLVLPEGFANNLMYMENVPVKVVIDSSNTTLAIVFKNILESYQEYIGAVQLNAVALYDLMEQNKMNWNSLQKENMSTSIQLITTALTREEWFEKDEVEEVPHTNIQEYYLWAIIVMLLLYGSMLSGTKYLEEYSLGTFIRIRIIGNSCTMVMGGILCMNIGITSLLLVLIITQLGLAKEIALAVLTFLVAVNCLLHIGSYLIACLCKERKVFFIVSNMIILMSAILGGVAIPVTFLPEEILKLSRCTPSYWMIRTVLEIKNQLLLTPARYLYGSFLGIAIIGLWLSYKISSTGNLNRSEDCVEKRI